MPSQNTTLAVELKTAAIPRTMSSWTCQMQGFHRFHHSAIQEKLPPTFGHNEAWLSLSLSLSLSHPSPSPLCPLSLSLSVSFSFTLSLSLPLYLPISLPLSLSLCLFLFHSLSLSLSTPLPPHLSLPLSLFLSLALLKSEPSNVSGFVLIPFKERLGIPEQRNMPFPPAHSLDRNVLGTRRMRLYAAARARGYGLLQENPLFGMARAGTVPSLRKTLAGLT